MDQQMIVALAPGNYWTADDSDLRHNYDTGDATVVHHRNRGKPSTIAWGPEPTRALLRLRQEHENDAERSAGSGTTSRKHMWQEIADGMAALGFDYGMNKVSKKWHNMLSTYNKNVIKLQTTGQINWEYFDDVAAYVRSRDSPQPKGDNDNDDDGEADEEEDDGNYDEDDDDGDEDAGNNADNVFDNSCGAGIDIPSGRVKNIFASPQSKAASNARITSSPSPLLVPLASPKLANGLTKRKAVDPLQMQSEPKRVQPLRVAAIGAVYQTIDEPVAAPKSTNKSSKSTSKPSSANAATALSAQRKSSASAATLASLTANAYENVAANVAAAASYDDGDDNDNGDGDDGYENREADQGAMFYQHNGDGGEVGMLEAGGGGDSAWMREYFQQKLELERKRQSDERQRHLDHINLQKMTLLLQEKMEKTKLEALRSLTEAINRLV